MNSSLSDSKFSTLSALLQLPRHWRRGDDVTESDTWHFSWAADAGFRAWPGICWPLFLGTFESERECKKVSVTRKIHEDFNTEYK